MPSTQTMDMPPPRPRRAMLYVPASQHEMLSKTHDINVDLVAYDLEDGVPKHEKQESRKSLAKFLSGPKPTGVREIGVRINSVDSGLALADLTTIATLPSVDTIIIPMVQSASDINFVVETLRQLQTSQQSDSPSGPYQSMESNGHNNLRDGQSHRKMNILPLIETAKGMMNLREICEASSLIIGLGFAAEDYCHDLRISRSPGSHELLNARSRVVAHARAFSFESVIDMTCKVWVDDEAVKFLREECEAGKRLGFNGKQCIHPKQIEIIQDIFKPSARDINWAAKVIESGEQQESMGKGVWVLEGQMVDAPHMKMAENILETAELCDVDVQGVKQMYAA